MHCDREIKEHFPNVPFNNKNLIGFVNTPSGQEWYLAILVKEGKWQEDCLYEIVSELNGPVTRDFVAFIDPLDHRGIKRGFSFVRDGQYFTNCTEIDFFSQAYLNGYATWGALHLFRDGKLVVEKGDDVSSSCEGVCVQKNCWPLSRLDIYRIDESGFLEKAKTKRILNILKKYKGYLFWEL